MSLYNDASLAMIPSAVKDGKLYSIRPSDGSGDFTFSRGSNLAATRVDVNGLIEKGRENLLLQSNQFDTTWTATRATLTSGQSGYDGSSDAWKLESTDADNSYIRQNINQSSVQTFSVYAKSGNVDYIYFRIAGTTSQGAYIDLSNGSVSDFLNESNIIGGVVVNSVGNGWYKISISVSTTTSDVRFYVSDSGDATSDIGSFIYIQDAQLEVGLVATDYIETTTTTAVAGITEDLPRLDYSGGASCPSLLLEPTRTNLVTQSEYINSSDYVTANWTGTITNNTNETLSPEGVYNATKFVKSGASDRVYFQTSVSDGTYTGSMYFKAVSGQEGNTIEISVKRFGGGSGSNTKLITLTNEWQRVDVTATLSGGTNTAIYIADFSSSGNATEFYCYGIQLESNASYPSSYIPSYGSAVTRSGDAMNNSSLGLTDCTFFVDFVPLSSIMGLLDFYDNSNALIFYIAIDAVKYLKFNSVQGGTIGAILGPLTIGDRIKLAFTLNASNGDVTIFINGTKYSTYSTTISSLNKITHVSSFGYYNNTEFNQIISFPTILTDSECIALTTL